MSDVHDTGDRSAAFASLRGLALGDSFGERWFFHRRQKAIEMVQHRTTPEDKPWQWTDDTAMALALVRVLTEQGTIDQQDLAESFADIYAEDPYRNFGSGMHQLLPKLREDPGNWATYARTLFGGEGSLGNGAAMRAAPLGAWFRHDPEQAVAQAVLSAEVTHAHPEGIAGGVAVAAAAALAAGPSDTDEVPDPHAFLAATADLTPAGVIRDGLLRAADLAPETSVPEAAAILGSGKRIRASDTVPFAVWTAAHHLDDLTDALWTTAAGFGDVDTTCAITGGIVAARTGLRGVSARWLELAEELPEWVE
ncbi:ADP-ribosylglycohydrolase [Catenulispora sp. GP43]|uniref:ADP-ribosylglycohydrolase family protein n=1 Tax=Catenulispora sp. GP43 TaxID=3156263 RepID=UPI0035175FAE